MNPYEELAGYRFGSGRDYDKRSVETFRARVLNLVDDLLNQVTQLQDEVADLRDRCRAASADAVPLMPVPPVVPTSWLDALAGLEDTASEGMTEAATPLPAAAFPAPALGSWLADLEAPADDDLDDSAGSTAELLLAAAGNAVAVQAAAAAARNGDLVIPPAPVAPAPSPRTISVPPPPASPIVPLVAFAGDVPPPPPPAGALPDRADAPPSPSAGSPAPTPIALDPFTPSDGASRVMIVTPGSTVVGEPPPITELSRLPIVLDDGEPIDEPLPTPVRHWGGWMRDAAGPA